MKALTDGVASVTKTGIVEEVTPELLKRSLGHEVEVVAFGLTYRGKLKKVDTESGTIRIVDKGDSAVLEIERIESFEPVP